MIVRMDQEMNKTIAVFKRMPGRTRQVLDRAIHFLKPRIMMMGINDVRALIYDHPEHERFPRSSNLWTSIDVVADDDGMGKYQRGLLLFPNPDKAQESYSYRQNAPTGLKSWANGPHKYYPAYLIENNIFGRRASHNMNFLGAWNKSIPPIVRRYTTREIMKRLAVG